MATESLAPLSAPSVEADAIVSKETHPPSPGPPAVSFPAFLTGLLQSLLSGENQLPCPLPTEFSAALLRIDELEAVDDGREGLFSAKGVPKYPLYKYVAHGLSEWISTGSFPRTVETMEGIDEDERKFEKIGGWTQTVVDVGASLMEVCKEVSFQLHCQEPYYSQLKDGKKTGEGRCAGGYYSKLQAGDGLLFNRTLLLHVKDIKRYNTFKEMLEIEGLSNVLPGVAAITEGVQVYRNFYSETKERENGVVGIHVRHHVNRRQPFELLYDILKELHVEGSKLTVGARALAKHVHRCSNGWWGKFTGTEPAKNEISLRKLRSVIEDAVWMNVHVVPVPVFEIRVSAGYGARWSQDGSQFRGFLEPAMEEGYLHKWRH